MPIIDIEIVTRRDEVAAPGLARKLADAVGEAMGAGPGRLWVRLRHLPPEAYAENHAGEDRPDPVFVTITASAPPAGESLERLVGPLTRSVALLTDRPAENVHVLVEPAAAGRIAFGGKVVR